MLHTPRGISRVLVAVGLAAGTVTTVVGLAPAASYADSATVVDAVGDPVRIDDRDDDGELETTPAPDAQAVDIESTTVVYRHHVLVVRAQARMSTAAVSPRVRVRADGQDVALSTDDRGRVYLDDRGGGGLCRGAEATQNPLREVYRLEIPARCLGTPDGVRVGVQLTRVGDTTPSSVTLDDAVKGGGGRLYYRIGLGPRVERG